MDFFKYFYLYSIFNIIMQNFSNIVNRQISESLEPININEANIFQWLSDFFKKTSRFIDTWIKKGNKKYKIDLSKGTIQSNSKEAKSNISELKKSWKNNKIYKQCYPQTNNFIQHEQEQVRPESVTKNDWDNVVTKIYVYTPNVNYDGENYPTAIAIYPQKKIELLEGFFNIQSFETSNLIQNKDINPTLFEMFVDDIKKSKGGSGITIVPKNPSQYTKLSYHGKTFEQTEIEDEDEKAKKNKEKDDNEIDKNIKKIIILKLEF